MQDNFMQSACRVHIMVLLLPVLCAAATLQSHAASEDPAGDPIGRDDPTIASIQARLQALENTLADSSTPEVSSGFDFGGYLRSGFGINSRGGHQVPFQAPGADAKYRLGNEAETYLETVFSQRLIAPDSGPFFNIQVRVSYMTVQDTAANIHDDGLALREGYVETGGFEWMPDLKFWAGQRFYRRQDIHINDFYILDMSGYGGGVEDIPLSGTPVKLAMAYMGGSSDDYEFPRTGRVAKNCLDLRLYNIPAPWGTGTLWFAPASVKGGEYRMGDGDMHVYESSVGYAAGVFHDAPLPRQGANRLSLQYGQGAGSDFNPVVQHPTPTIDDTWRFRITETVLIQPSDRLSLMTALIYQINDNGAEDSSRINWASAGVRPIFSFTRHLALAAEIGVDWVDNQPDDYRGMLYKFTVAPEIRFGPAFFDRPVLRAYFTYAAWSDEFKGRVGESAYADQTSGLSLGLQCEAWW